MLDARAEELPRFIAPMLACVGAVCTENMAFDLLHLDGGAVRHLPYWRRRELLAELDLKLPVCRTPRHFVGDGEALLAVTAEQGLEGVVAKRLDAPYAEGRRSNAWVNRSIDAASA